MLPKISQEVESEGEKRRSRKIELLTNVAELSYTKYSKTDNVLPSVFLIGFFIFSNTVGKC